MRGNCNYQVQTLYRESGICCIGQSRHAAKEAARSAGAVTAADIAQKTGIHSYNTADSYRDTWRAVLEFARGEFRCKDIEHLTAEHVRAYLEAKIEEGIAQATFANYAAACGKLQQALLLYAERHGTGMRYDFKAAISEARREANAELERFSGTRAYSSVQLLISAIGDVNLQLAATIQHQGGARLNEVSLVKAHQLRAISPDPITGDLKGKFAVQGKGGKVRYIAVDPDTYHKLERCIQEHGHFAINKDGYRSELKIAASASGQDYNGSHGLRWNYARERYAEAQQHGFTSDQALVITSKSMGHERSDITLHYLR